MQLWSFGFMSFVGCVRRMEKSSYLERHLSADETLKALGLHQFQLSKLLTIFQSIITEDNTKFFSTIADTFGISSLI